MRKKIIKEDWLYCGLDTLEKNGVENITVEGLARKLNISKSIFYWYFKDRKELLKDILNYWSREYTNVIAGNPELIKLKPKDRLIKIVEIICKYSLTKYEASINAWALSDPNVKKSVRRVYKIRHNYIKNVLSELGFKGDQLEIRTRFFVLFNTWHQSMYKKVGSKDLDKMIKLQIEFITKK